jgi:MinD superfamily P-loop ATPase
MKQIVIISGKGGTGKTVLTASLAVLAQDKVMADCDVDAADLHLLLNPKIKERYEFRSGNTAVINNELCQECGECLNICRFEAITEEFEVDSFSCEGCGVCSLMCPEEAISMEQNVSGEWFISHTKYGPMVHAKLGIAEENSGKLVTLVRQNAKRLAEEANSEYVIIDGPPGIGCPVIASLADVDLALIVTEPTLSGIHDMERITSVSEHFKTPTKVVINKCDINEDNSRKIQRICQDNNMDVLAQIPFSQKVSQSIVEGVPIIEYCNDDITKDIARLWGEIK